MDYSEKWGVDVEEAVKLALADLKLSRDEVEVTVLEETFKRLFRDRLETRQGESREEKAGRKTGRNGR